jgi:hypothetical protein
MAGRRATTALSAANVIKSYLLMHGKKPAGHSIAALYNETRQLGLKIPHDQLGLQNVVGLLQNEPFLLEGGSQFSGRRFRWPVACNGNCFDCASRAIFLGWK